METELKRVFRGKKVLITGHTGFKGSWLTLLLSHFGAQVSGISLPPPTLPSHFELAGIKTLVSSHHTLDIRNETALRELVLKLQPEFIFHLAAQPLVLRSYENPLETFAVNVQGTAHVLEAARQISSLQGVLVITTDKVYENDERGHPFLESDPLGASDPYSTSKAMTELLTKSYHASFFKSRNVGVATARAGNVIGGGDFAANRLVPDCIRALLAGRPIPLRNPWMQRPWMHVLDPLFGYLMLGAKLIEDPINFSTAFNFGPKDPTALTCQAIANKLICLHGSGSVNELSLPQAPKEKSTLQLNSEKAKAHLGFTPRHSIDSALEDTLTWYSVMPKKLEESTMLKASMRSIDRYLSMVEDKKLCMEVLR
ncbi:CDP-glucose 4,6-dehydratase [Estrella lausannensis]|uniref:CDP-glucose 4,6-dehydratase n=1 Tax=Estrella lausannensis TaxID=483423 RepID=A0A0H5DMT5_9BACT|nr:CDP-glucose 4,6-dehydratase [Estrella lausannensis]CRX37471.1 CDP-glucose 4,6-dehydratase [Estrella lausannensis]